MPSYDTEKPVQMEPFVVETWRLMAAMVADIVVEEEMTEFGPGVSFPVVLEPPSYDCSWEVEEAALSVVPLAAAAEELPVQVASVPLVWGPPSFQGEEEVGLHLEVSSRVPPPLHPHLYSMIQPPYHVRY